MPKKKFDFEIEEKEVLKALNNLEKVLLKRFGEPCRKLGQRCPNCMMWANFDALKLNFY